MGTSTFQIRETIGIPGSLPSEAGEATGTGPLVQKLAEQMIERWRWGERPLAEEYLERHPVLRAQPEAAIELIYEEICLRREYGQSAATADVLERFPEWRAQLQVLLDCHELLAQPPTALHFPEPGESLGDFQLLAELGRGSRGRVFLATQPALAGRPVVIKITSRDGREHLSLGRLQHTHIVPLYSVQDHPERNLRALCMPYFGGATLAWLIAALRGLPSGKRSGKDLLDALDRAPSWGLLAMPVEGPARRVLAGASYVQAMCWIGACLADALHYAQERNLVHLDLKPSNVLLAADGQPMLLDFHLASEPIHPGGPLPDWLGGTPAYMSSEQQLALAAVREGRAVPCSVDSRSDIYSLGLVLYEDLCGVLPPPVEDAGLHLRRCNPQVSLGLADVLNRCLAEQASDRYQTAADLAADLRRHLADLPLKGVPNRSLGERWRKWRRRRPHTLTLGAVFVAVLVGGILGRTYLQNQASKAREALDEGREQLQAHRYSEAAAALKRGLTLTEDLPWNASLREDLEAHFNRAERARAAQDLHALAERIRHVYGEESASPNELKAVQTHCNEFWSRRHVFLERSAANLEAGLEEQLHRDFLDLAVLWADLQVRLAAPDKTDAARSEAFQLLMRAEGLFGPSPVLDRERQAYAEALGRADMAQAVARRTAERSPRTAWEHYAIGRTLLRSGKLEQAAAAFDRAIEMEPQSLWANFYKGKCAYRLKRFDDAVLAFTACIVLAPDFPGYFYNRATAFTELGHLDKALADYDRALRLDPAMANALVNRGILHYRSSRLPEALHDLQEALAQGADAALVHFNLALVHLARQDRAAAQVSLRQALQADPDHQQSRELQKRLAQ